MIDVLVLLGMFAFSFATGYVLISRVPQLLHTPLMSMTNALSAVTILGALLIFAEERGGIATILGGIALVTAAFNVIGGFVITDRMLRLFKRQR